MVVGAFPAAKLGVLALKQISKPIANIIKNRAKQSPFFSRHVCMPPAQFYNWMEVKTKMWALNLGRPVNVPKLDENMAIELGANLLGEVIIFTIGAAVLIFEYIRQSNKEQKKEEALQREKLELQQTVSELALQVEWQDAHIRETRRMIADLESRTWLPKKLRLMYKNEEDSMSEDMPGNRPNLSGLQNQTYKNEKAVDAHSQTVQVNLGIVRKSLVYLNYY